MCYLLTVKFTVLMGSVLWVLANVHIWVITTPIEILNISITPENEADFPPCPRLNLVQCAYISVRNKCKYKMKSSNETLNWEMGSYLSPDLVPTVTRQADRPAPFYREDWMSRGGQDLPKGSPSARSDSSVPHHYWGTTYASYSSPI